MSQPTHFLERLTRVTPAEGALAAQLARDSTLLRGFLDKAALKDPAVGDAPRVALPLSSAAECAHMIVARDGNAVTCLASGMPMHDVPVLPFVWVTEYAQQADAVLNAAVVLQRDRNPLERFIHAPHAVTRADHQVLTAMVPLLGSLLSECVTQAADLLRHDVPQWTGTHVPDAAQLGATWWPRYLRGALAMMLGGEKAFPAAAVVLHSATPDVYLAGRAAWCAVKRGTQTLDVLENLATEHGLWGGEHELGVAVALENPLLAGRVRGFLKAFRHQQGAGYLQLLTKALDDPRRAVDHALVALLPLLPSILTPGDAQPGSPLDADHLTGAKRALGDVAGVSLLDVAGRMHRRLPSLVERLLQGDPDVSLPLWTRLVRWCPVRFNVLPLGTLLCARAPREAWLPDVSPSADWAEQMGGFYMRDVVRSFMKRDAPAAEKPGPNAPCPCGSGKKFKKCHGAAD